MITNTRKPIINPYECRHCKSDQLKIDYSERGDNYLDVTCLNCGRHWTESYELIEINR